MTAAPFSFSPTCNYKLIYVFSVDIPDHKGCLKVGMTEVNTPKDADELPPNCPELNAAAMKRIKSYTNTVGVKANLLYTEIAVREKTNKEGKIFRDGFKDKAVHAVLVHSHVEKRGFKGTTAGEWFEVDLPTVKKAIQAVKEGKPALSSQYVPTEAPPIQLREEQRDAVDKTLARFKKKNDMLWDAKMRFGKTLTALQVIKEGNFPKVAIITHRPVVHDGWEEDFHKIFRKSDQVPYLYVDKSALTASSYNPHDQQANDEKLAELVHSHQHFIYFASLQDLRGSQRVGGKFKKNEGVFDLDWDLVIVDEAHEGTQTSLGDAVVKAMVKKHTKVLALSGTPFNILDQYEEEAIYVWDYVMEQNRKNTWEEKHPGEPNPYADLPQLNILTYSLGESFQDYTQEDLEGKAFNFREFFRTWTGDEEQDGRKMPEGAKVGDFIHREDVKQFLHLITKESETSRYPFSTKETRALFKHTLWMVPGVAAAKALSNMLHDHVVFQHFGIANVAGEGDDYEEEHYDDALAQVRKTIQDHEYSITLSCGRLTTGVTVPEWTGVMMLAGSVNVAASAYMQTIFRVQSAGCIDGKQKENAYVFDFAPDRTLRVLAETVQISRKVAKNNSQEEKAKKALADFLNYCPVISIEGTRMEPYDVPKMMGQLKNIFVMKAIRNGFDDPAIYSDKLMNLTDVDLTKFEELKGIVGESKQTVTPTSVIIDDQGFDDEEHAKDPENKKPHKEKTEEEKARLAELKKKKEERKRAISILRAISIRMPLLIYGADVPWEQEITLQEFPSLVDEESWKEFMPEGVTKAIFGKFVEYYDADVFVNAGKEIRRLARSADKLAPTERVKQIARIFSYFKNPDKETVLTPWRVVNMHLADTIGGWCFWNEEFTETLEEPRYVQQEEVTRRLFGNTKSRILEINSKSGLYPLYVAYSLYRNAIGAVPEEEISPQWRTKCWKKVVGNHLFVVCKTPMAVSITRRTLMGYQTGQVNTQCFKELIHTLKYDPDRFVEKVKNGNHWNHEDLKMKQLEFDAIVGNPPYQEEVAKKVSETNGQAPRQNVFHYFQIAADRVSCKYTSLIYPGGRWLHRSGKGMEKFGLSQINDPHLVRIDFYQNAADLFPSVAISDGITLVFKDMRKTTPGFTYVYHVDGNSHAYKLSAPGDELIPLNPRNLSILQKTRDFMKKHGFNALSNNVYSRSFYGIESDFVEMHSELVTPLDGQSVPDYNKKVKLLTNDQAGKAGRAKWYLVDRKVIPSNQDSISLWKVVVSSANAGGQKRDWQIEVLDNHSAFGRSRLALGMFKTEQEAKNFLSYCNSNIIRFLFRMSDESLSSLAKEVPDLGNYTKQNRIIDFSKDIDVQLCSMIGFDEPEMVFVMKTIHDIDASRGKVSP